MKKMSLKRVASIVTLTLVLSLGLVSPGVLAESGVSMSPMKQSIVLDPGEHYESSILISNPGTSDEDFDYMISVAPFYVNENYQSVFEEVGSHNQIVDWMKLNSSEKGSLKPNETKEIYFSIDVPEWAPGGGQYAAISVSSDPDTAGNEVTINEQMGISHVIYAEITGETNKQGEFEDVSVPGFLFSGNIHGSSSIKNTGNTHGEAKYTLKVYPLFSSEEIYSNEENPDTHMILPDRSFYNETEWDKTPGVGIFNVTYTIEYEGVVKEVSKMVIVCPIWLLFIILAIIFGIIIWIVMRVRSRKKKSKKSDNEE